MLPVHPIVFPFNRKRPIVTYIIKSTNYAFKIYPAPAYTPEIPVPAVITEFGMPSKTPISPGTSFQ
jgi:hypothetical protein